MAIQDIENAKILRKQGDRLGRAGLAERVLSLLGQYKDPSYKEAMELAGRLHAVSLASRFDEYWEEQSLRGFQREINDLIMFEYTNNEAPIEAEMMDEKRREMGREIREGERDTARERGEVERETK